MKWLTKEQMFLVTLVLLMLAALILAYVAMTLPELAVQCLHNPVLAAEDWARLIQRGT